MIYFKNIKIILDVQPSSIIKDIHDVYIVGCAAPGNFTCC